MSVVTSQEFNRNPTSVKREADHGPVYITEHGDIAYVVISINDYRHLKGEPQTDLVDYLRADEPDDYELPAVTINVPGAAL